MPSHSVQIENNRVLLPVLVFDAALEPRDWQSDTEFTALVDTGATHSMISGQVVRDLNLATIGTDTFMPASGEPTATTLHSVAFAVPVASEPYEAPPGLKTRTFSIRDGVVVLQMPKRLEGFDVVIGMDVLMDFRILMHNGVFTISR